MEYHLWLLISTTLESSINSWSTLYVFILEAKGSFRHLPDSQNIACKGIQEYLALQGYLYCGLFQGKKRKSNQNISKEKERERLNIYIHLQVIQGHTARGNFRVAQKKTWICRQNKLSRIILALILISNKFHSVKLPYSETTN